MKEFAELLDQLYFTGSHLAKSTILMRYIASTPDPDRGYAMAAIAGALNFNFFKRSLIKDLIYEQADPYLFELSYDYVGDLSETAAYLWTSNNSTDLPSLSTIVAEFSRADKDHTKDYLRKLLNCSNATQRWALLKLGTGSLRIGVSARFLKQVLAQYGGKQVQEIEAVWHTVAPPYIELFAWLENRGAKPNIIDKIFFHPVMLSHQLSDKELLKITPQDFLVEWKYDGIRIQLIITLTASALFSRTGDDISKAFPDVFSDVSTQVVLDGELVIKTAMGFGSFNQLQQRLNRKLPSKKLIETSPAHIVIYDALSIDNEDLRELPIVTRRQRLSVWYDQVKPTNMTLSPLLNFHDTTELSELRNQIIVHPTPAIEGLMIKRKDSRYIAGRPMGLWFKWKRDPFLVDAVLMYAQRGHGKRSSFYSDYTLGLWQDQQLLPIGKAYFGFTDDELKQLDNWVRQHTIHKFGPVREVEKKLVMELAFDAVQLSKRHKSGYALRFPRINRIRWDKPADEADTLASLAKLVLAEKGQAESTD